LLVIFINFYFPQTGVTKKTSFLWCIQYYIGNQCFGSALTLCGSGSSFLCECR
jgi:hypothetical protein